jgi:hypothetical protein
VERVIVCTEAAGSVEDVSICCSVLDCLADALAFAGLSSI